MAIIKKVDNKNIVLADTPKIDHSQLSGTNSYGAHPISAIRKLPEKLSALKKKDEEHDNQISNINEDIGEINEEIVNLHNKDVELTNNIAEVKRHARQISINYDEENKEVTFTNYDGGTNSFVVPKVDEDTLTYRDTDHITLKKVYVDEETIKPLVEKYIGSIKSENRKENWKDNGVRGPKGKTVRTIALDLQDPKATVITNFSKEMKYSMYNSICNSILQGVLDLRYTENIREKEGGTYGVGVQAGSSRIPYSEYSMSMQFDCDPARAEHLKSLIYAETEKLQKEAPTEEEVSKVVSNMLKLREQSKNHNSYWMNALYSYYVSGINPADPKNYEDIINKVTPKDIQKFAQQLFKGADVVDITFVPKEK